MKYYLDTEFIENGPKYPVRLISIGLVCEDGREYYAIDEDAPLHMAGEWVKKNVVPHLDWMYARNRSQIAWDIVQFVDDTPEFWGYYADYDWVVFCQMYGTMVQLPSKFPKYCMDVKQYAKMLGDPHLPSLPGVKEHHALYDAQETKYRHEFLVRLESSIRSKQV